MSLSNEINEELDILELFNSDSTKEGIKVHAAAEPKTIAATKRLYAKGLISQVDGGYLTPLGIQAFDLAVKLKSILT